MKNTLCKILMGAACLNLASCSQTDDAGVVDDADGMPIAVHTHVLADDNLTAGPSGRLLFWSDESFHDRWMKKDPTVLPRYTVFLEKEINHYSYDRHVYYETPYIYPVNFGKIHATGYAPDNVLSPVAGKGYTELSVSVNDGSVDLLTCDGCLAHSASMNPDNTFLKKEKELKFRHLTSKLTFLGVRTDEMVGLVGVRKIRIKFNAPTNEHDRLVVPKTLQLYTSKENGEDYSTYVVSEKVQYPYEKKLYHESIIPPNDTVTLGTCYVLSNGFEYGETEGKFNPVTGEWVGALPSGTPNLGITVEAELYDAKQGSSSSAYVKETWTLDNIEKWESLVTGNQFLPGYEYKVTIIFNRAGIALHAEAVPWNSEELHEYPVHPN